ncbi:MAG: TolC family protein [Candidatus Sulfopaludibacter sp.]|nr:TolC family protein [Candidatus Sulfopaludibacter sp.]
MQSILPILGLGLAFSCQGAFAQTPASAGPIAFTLQQAMVRARQYSPQIYTANLAALSAREDTAQAKAAMLPTAEAISGYIYTQPNGTPSGIFVPNDGVHVYAELLDVHSDIYNPGKRAEYRRAMASEALAKARKDLAERGLVATVTQNFYGMAVAQRKFANAQASLREAKDFQDLTEKQERGGEAAKVDVIKARLQVQQRERELQDAQANVDKSRMQFAVVLFPNYTQEFSVIDDLDSAPKLPAYSEIKTLAGNNSPDIRAAEAAVQQQNFAIASARAAYLPSLSVDYFFGLEATQLALHDPQGFNNVGSSVAAQLNIPIWNWGATRSKVRQAELQLQQAKNDLSLTQRTLLSEMESYYLEAQVATSQIASLRDSLTLSVENLRLTRLRYTAGESTAQEVVDAQTTLVQARNAFDDGLVRYRLALANLQTLTGAF